MVVMWVLSMSTMLYSQKNSFREVTAKLEKNGNFYMYLSTEDAMSSFKEQTTSFKKILLTMPSINTKNRGTIEKGFNLFFKIFDESGIAEISGVGISSKKHKNGLYNNIMFLHHYPNKGNGKIWTLFGEKAHPLPELKFLPTNTILANFYDIDAGNTWKWINNSIMDSQIPEVQKGFSQLLAKAAKNGINITQLINSINGGMGMVITMDEQSQITVPVGGKKSAQIPEPGIMILMKVKDDTIFNLIQEKCMQGKDKKNHFAKRADSKGKKTLVFAMGIPFLPGPAVAVQSNGYLMIASSMKMVDNVLAVKTGKQKALKKLAKDIPLDGNGFQYVSPRLQKIVCDIQEDVMKGDIGKTNQMAIIQKLFMNPKNNTGGFSTYSFLKDGMITRSGSSVNAATILVTQLAIAPIGIMSAMLLPALSMARESARKISCCNNLKQIGLGLRFFSSAYDDKFPDKDGSEGLQMLNDENYGAFLTNKRVYVCPSTDTKPARNGDTLTEDTVSYVYFGGFTEADSVYIPLAFDKPGNHDKYVNILFLDGHVKGYAGSNFNSCQDVVKFLLTKNKYSKKVAGLLMKKAAAADKRLNK